jgi:inosine triphosphate pyrophosphatase
MKIESLLLITGNQGKLDEFSSLLNIGTLLFESKALEISEIQSMQLEEIGKFKTNSALSFTSEVEKYDAVMTDDTALSCDALNGLPGPFVKWFLECVGAGGLYDLIKGNNNDCTAGCLLTIGLTKTGELFQFLGEVQGKIVAPKGNTGFGWDGVFLPNGEKLTYGQMMPDKKNVISHRALAVKKLRSWITENG